MSSGRAPGRPDVIVLDYAGMEMRALLLSRPPGFDPLVLDPGSYEFLMLDCKERRGTYIDESFPLPTLQRQPVVVPAPLVYKAILAIVAVMKGARV